MKTTFVKCASYIRLIILYVIHRFYHTEISCVQYVCTLHRNFLYTVRMHITFLSFFHSISCTQCASPVFPRHFSFNITCVPPLFLIYLAVPELYSSAASLCPIKAPPIGARLHWRTAGAWPRPQPVLRRNLLHATAAS